MVDLLVMVRSQLRHRLGRAVALMSGIAVATSAFTVLTGAARTQELQVRRTVDSNYRSAYDILVRPNGAQSEAERAQGVVQAGFLSGIFGGISLEQWQRIQRIPGVDVAAPMALVGYVMASASVPVDLAAQIPAGQDGAVFRITTTTSTDQGLSRTPPAVTYQYVTRNQLVENQGGQGGPGPVMEELPSGAQVAACPVEAPPPAGPFDTPDRIGCDSTKGSRSVVNGETISTRPASGPVGYKVNIRVPMLIGAIDPAAEARLDGLDGAVVSGRYLADHQGAGTRQVPAAVGTATDTTATTVPQPTFPVLAAARSSLDQTVDVAVQRLSGTDGRTPAQLGTAALGALAGQPVTTRTVTAEEAYGQLLGGISAGTPASLNSLAATWTAGPLTFTEGPGGVLRPTAAQNPDSTWASGVPNSPWLKVPPSNAETPLRPVAKHLAVPQSEPGRLTVPVPEAVGVFDAAKLPATNPLTAVPLGAYDPPTTTPADAASTAALGGKALQPDGSLGGLLSQPPQLLTTLDALPALTRGAFQGDLHAADPISSVRVRVSGITGTDAVSRERVRLIAQQIQDRTGLHVDVTYGSSPHPTTIALDAGRLGRPELTVQQNWAKLGVAFTVLDALDRKSLTLFVLILAVCALFVTNSVGAAVRSRRTELGVLACLGWSPGRVLATLLGEVALLGLLAGLAGAALSWPVSVLFGLKITLARAAAAVPGAVLLALLAGAVPALRAARTAPAAAVRPAVSDAHRVSRARGISGLAASNVRRTPGRSLLGALSVAIGTCALTVLIGVTWTFRNALVGSLLGQAVSFQVRGIDYVAVATVVLLGALAVADVLYLGIRERAAELAALCAAGWDDRELGRLIVTEGALMGLLGALGGAAAGAAATATLAGALPAGIVATAAAVAAGGVLMTIVASLVPAALLRRTPIGQLLTED
ncbi:FtsX-like permease family protein [Kitasatospora indigofera]|uniref:FtsX-like permease family protein n=1 Tax=Kitasatospora indigofera TaxID=67307 RepID=UPI003686C4ED